MFRTAITTIEHHYENCFSPKQSTTAFGYCLTCLLTSYFGLSQSLKVNL